MSNRTPLDDAYIAAVEKGDIPAVAKALEQGANINALRGGDCSTIYIAVQSKNLPMAQFLLDSGIHDCRRAEVTPLYEATRLKDLPMVRLLLAHGADVDHINMGGKGALHMAASIGEPEIAAALLDAGASPHKQGECIVGFATPQEIALDGLSSNPGMGKHRETADVLQKYVEADEVDFPDHFDRKTLMFEFEDYVAPLDQPRLWQKFGEVTADMASRGEAPLSKADLLAVNAQGKTWLQRGVECQAAEAVMEHLRAQGEQLTAEDLLLPDGSASPLLQSFADHFRADALFDRTNWQGQGVEAMGRVYNALPDMAQDQVRNYHSLRMQLQQEERGHSQPRGR